MDFTAGSRNPLGRAKVDWIRCTRWLLPCPHGLPRLMGGSASTTLLSRPTQALLALRLQSCSSTLCGLLSRGCIQPGVAPVSMLVSYQTYQHLSGRVLPPLVICAVGAHCEMSSLVQRDHSAEAMQSEMTSGTQRNQVPLRIIAPLAAKFLWTSKFDPVPQCWHLQPSRRSTCSRSASYNLGSSRWRGRLARFRLMSLRG
jgi:hypothetical protein